MKIATRISRLAAPTPPLAPPPAPAASLALAVSPKGVFHLDVPSDSAEGPDLPADVAARIREAFTRGAPRAALRAAERQPGGADSTGRIRWPGARRGCPREGEGAEGGGSVQRVRHRHRGRGGGGAGTCEAGARQEGGGGGRGAGAAGEGDSREEGGSGCGASSGAPAGEGGGTCEEGGPGRGAEPTASFHFRYPKRGARAHPKVTTAQR